MARKQVPTYRKQKTKSGDRAFVELGGARYYLGVFGSKESREAYGRKIAEWTASGGITATDANAITIVEVVAAYWKFAEGYYVNGSGDATNEVDCIRQAAKPLTELYGKTRAKDFGPIALKAVRQKMIDLGWSRGYINRHLHRVKRVFKWAASEELIDAAVFHRLQCVEGLKRGRTKAREADRVLPVSDDAVNATMRHATPTLRAMIQVHRLTGMRPGELCRMRVADLDMSGKVWTYRPEHHKTEYLQRSRKVYIGPAAQDALRPLLARALQGYIFTPEQSERERRDVMHEARVTPLSCGNTPGSNRKPRPVRRPGERYTPDAYNRAVANACGRAFPAPEGMKGEALKQWRREHCWSPNRLRHSFATEVRRTHGLEAAQVLLGHAQADVTQVYAERDEQRAMGVIQKVG